MKTKKLKTLLLIFSLTSLLSCSVQQFPVNTNTKPFENGGRIFGEKTKGKEYIKAYDFYVVDINLSKTNTAELANKIKATSYTIETKRGFWAQVLNYCSYGCIDFRTVTIIKRQN